MSDLDRSRSLYALHQEEKRHEDRTKSILADLEGNSRELASSRMKLIEKLLDIAVKDEISKKIAITKATSGSDLNDDAIRSSARALIENQVKANLNTSRSIHGEHPFVSALGRLIHAPENTARGEISAAVQDRIQPHINEAMHSRHGIKKGPADPKVAPQQKGTDLQSVASAIASAKQDYLEKLKESLAYRKNSEQSDRRRRVEEAQRMFKKDIGDLTAIMDVAPEEYETNIGKHEAEVFSLRRMVARHRAEEDQLKQERRVQMSLIEAEEERLRVEADISCEQLVVLRRELEEKGVDLREIQESQKPKSGEWASNTIRIENELSLAIEKERQLRLKYDDIKRENDMLRAENTLLNKEVDGGVHDLNNMQHELQTSLDKLEQRVSDDKRRIYELREQQISDTRQINELRHRMLYRREDIRRQKRENKEAINDTIARIGVERELQKLASALAIEAKHRATKLSLESDQQMQTYSKMRADVDSELEKKLDAIQKLAIKLTNYESSLETVTKSGRDSKYAPAADLKALIDAHMIDWEREEKSAAASIASEAAVVDLNQRENERILWQLGDLHVLQDDVKLEGVDIRSTNVDMMQHIKDSLFGDVYHLRYQESKFNLIIELLHERSQRRDEGRAVLPLTRNRRMSLAERRSRREALDKEKKESDASLFHFRRRDLNNESSAGNQDTTGVDPFRMKVIQFIKGEIQPLYDGNQITKRRFVDVVSRVSAWFVSNHAPVSELSETDIGTLTRKIQETLTWQDQERLKQRSLSRVSETD